MRKPSGQRHLIRRLATCGCLGLLGLGPVGSARAAGTAAAAGAAETLGEATAPKTTAPTPVEKLGRPWAVGVTPAKQENARKFLQEGNGFLLESLFPQAADSYRKALAEWDHPGLHYNLALALINLDQPVEVYEQLKVAVSYGATPLGDEKFSRAQDYLKLIKKQLVEIDVRCDVKGAVVSLDGNEVFRVGDTRGRFQGFVRSGQHTVTAAKEGYATTERSKILLPGQPAVFSLKVYTPDQLISYRRRWPLSRPIAVTVLGGALLIAAGVMTVEARDRYDSYDALSSQTCATQGGCLNDANVGRLAALRKEGDRFQAVSAFLYAIGGVTLAAGGVLLFFDSAAPYHLNPDEDRKDVALVRRPSVSAWIGAGAGGVLGSWRF